MSTKEQLDASTWERCMTAITKVFDIEEIDWKDNGDYDFVKWFSRLKESQRKLGAIMSFVTIMQNGDPENENPKKILDTIDEIIEPQTNVTRGSLE